MISPHVDIGQGGVDRHGISQCTDPDAGDVVIYEYQAGNRSQATPTLV